MRQLYIVNAAQVVVSESHPEGVFSNVPDYPKAYDSRSYNATEQNPNGDEARALEVAQAEFYSRVSAFLSANNRAMWTVTLTRADGRQIMRESRGAFPDMTPRPEPEEAGIIVAFLSAEKEAQEYAIEMLERHKKPSKSDNIIEQNNKCRIIQMPPPRKKVLTEAGACNGFVMTTNRKRLNYG